MSLWVQLFHQDGTLAGSPLLLADLATEFALQLHQSLGPQTQAVLELVQVADVPEISGDPTLYHLTFDWGYARLTVMEDHRTIYSHPHRISEVVASGLRRRALALDSEASWWAFALCEAPEVYTRLQPQEVTRLWGNVRSTPQSEGSMTLDRSEDPTRPRLRIRPVPPDPLPVLDLSTLMTTQVDAGAAAVTVLMPSKVFEELKVTRAFSHDLESGGFLVGIPYQVQDDPKRHVVLITGALPAEHTGASLLHFTFTGDSFAAVKQILRQQRPLDKLVGWYHTHLFGAREEMGLSTVDVQLHRVTFQQPWQLAGLVNMSEEGRVVRFYVRETTGMKRCPILLIQEGLPNATS